MAAKLMCVLIAILATAGATGCISSLSPGLHKVHCDKLILTYHIPSQCGAQVSGKGNNSSTSSNSSCGLIMDVHGYSMTADIENNNTNMRELGEKYGYVVLQPSQGLGISPLTSWEPARDDDAVDAVLLEAVYKLGAQGTGVLDTNRVHFMGFSQGSSMTWRFICRHAADGLFASVAALSCSSAEDSGAACLANASAVAKVPPLPVLFSQGTRDGICGDAAAHRATRDILVAGWGLGQRTLLEHGPWGNRTRYSQVRSDGSHMNTRAVFDFLQWDYVANYTFPSSASANEAAGLGHCFPGSQDSVRLNPYAPLQWAAFGCPYPDPRTAAFAIGDVVMDFFRAYAKPADHHNF